MNSNESRSHSCVAFLHLPINGEYDRETSFLQILQQFCVKNVQIVSQSLWL